MKAEEFEELIKVAAEKIKDDTVFQMLKSNSIYQKDSKREGKAEQKYMQLELTKKQKAVCDELLQVRDRQDFEYSTTAYIAGMYDAYRILAVLFPEKWELKEISEIFSKEK